jgi:serine/threonine protein kinase
MSGLEGTTLGHYRLKHLLGKGGMSEVYLAYDEHQHSDVAVKVIHKDQSEHVERLQREVTTMRALTHDHILPVLDVGHDDPWHYLVMPYLAHGTLRARLKTQGPLTMEEAGVILEQIASALQYAHEQGILHRDIKSSNILLRDKQYAYLGDFGLAKVVEERSDITRSGYVMGTVEYMAPELAEEPASPSSDIYALSILLYEMVTGNVPFQGGTSLGVYLKQQLEQPVRPSLLNPTLSSPVEQVILRALEKDPNKRLKTPQALAQTYRHALKASDQTPTLPILVSNPPQEATAVAIQFLLKPLKSWLLYLSSRSHKAIAVLMILVLLFATSLSLAFFVHNSGQTPAVQGMRGASAQFDTINGIKSPQITPTPQNTSTGNTNKSTHPSRDKDGNKHRHGND